MDSSSAFAISCSVTETGNPTFTAQMSLTAASSNPLRVDFDGATVQVKDDSGVEGVVVEVVDEYVGDLRVEGFDDAAQEVVRLRSWRVNVTEPHCDGFGLGRTNPDQEVTLGLLLLEDDDTVVVLHAHAYKLNIHLYHGADTS
jgi:hypothetical protein